MKNKFLILTLVFSAAVSSCSTYKNTEKNMEDRKVASIDFECSFSDMVDGKKTSFVFIPELLKLSMTNDKSSDVVYLEQDNFLSGGFSFVMDKKQESKEWPVKKVEFISFAQKPKITVSFMRTPAGERQRVISKVCE